MARADVSCPQCGFRFSGLEVGFFRVLKCLNCDHMYRWEITGVLTACDQQGNALQTTPVEDEFLEEENAMTEVFTPPELIDVNTASVKELSAVPSIGKTVAGRIVAYRDENGPYQQVFELAKVRGLSAAGLAKIAGYFTAGDGVAGSDETLPEPTTPAPRPTAQSDRNEAIVTRWKDGLSPGELGREHNLSYQRVRIIIGTALMREYRAAQSASG